MSMRRKFVISSAVCVLTAAAMGFTSAQASEAGAFIGGVLATKVIGNMRDRTEAEQDQADAMQAQAQNSSRQQSSGAQSPEERIKQLDKLAAGGYITPAEYKQKKQAILDSM